MLKKILIIFFSLISISFAYNLNNLKITSDKNKFKIYLTPINSNVKLTKNFYDYGINIDLNNFSFNKIFVKKINEKFLIKIIPIKKNKTLIKIQSLDKIDKNLFKIESSNGNIILSYGYKEKKLSHKINKEDKIIEEVTKSVFNKPVKQILPKKNKKEQTSNSLPIKNFTIDKSDFMNRMIKTYSLLAIICIFLIGLAFLLKKVKNRSIFTSRNKEFFKIVYRQYLSPKKEIALIKVYDEYYLIGITEYSINLISKIESENLKDKIKLIEGEKETKKFIKYIKEENEKLANKEKSLDKELLISSIEKKIRKYRDLIS